MPRWPCLICGAVTPATRCPAHQAKRVDTRREADRPAHRAAYLDPVYRKARARLRGQPCWICGNPSDTVDHILPLSRGGTNDPANLAPACRSCNSARR